MSEDTNVRPLRTFFLHLSPKEAWHAAGLPSAVCTASQGAILHSLMIFQLKITSHLICDYVPHCVLTCKQARWHKHCYAHPTEIVKYSGRQWKQQRNRWCSCATCHILIDVALKYDSTARMSQFVRVPAASTPFLLMSLPGLPQACISEGGQRQGEGIEDEQTERRSNQQQ